MNKNQEKIMKRRIDRFSDFTELEISKELKSLFELYYRLGFLAGQQAEVEIFVEKNERKVDIII